MNIFRFFGKFYKNTFKETSVCGFNFGMLHGMFDCFTNDSDSLNDNIMCIGKHTVYCTMI